ncbi:MAG: ATP-binding protein [Chlamydiota bacterium]|nr:ATP-binding protein [Chlamydiota bacterium]
MNKLNYKDFPILIVDDERENTEAFQMEFEEYFTIYTANSAQEALAILKEKGEFPLVIADQRMPEMTGVDLLKEIFNHTPQTIRFLITAYADIEVVIEAINSGKVYKYVHMPWDHEDVKVSIMHAIDTYFLTKDRACLIEEKINTIKKAAEASRLASLGTLAAGVAHEINNPLVSVNTFLALLPDKLKECFKEGAFETDSSFWKDFYHLTFSELERVQSLVRELLYLSKPPQYNFESTGVLSLVKDEMKVFESAAKGKNVRVSIDEVGDVPEFECERNRIKQLLLNLVINAIQACNQGGEVVIRAEGIGATEQNRRVQISVKDTGVGIPEEVRQKIFEPFFSTKEKGTGLGLMITDFIVRQHNGSIRVESEVGKGTAFILSFPLEFKHQEVDMIKV